MNVIYGHIILLAAFGMSLAAPTAAQASQPCALTPVLIEDFKTDRIATYAIGSAKWTAHTPWNGDFGDAAFGAPNVNSPFSSVKMASLLRLPRTTPVTGDRV